MAATSAIFWAAASTNVSRSSPSRAKTSPGLGAQLSGRAGHRRHVRRCRRVRPLRQHPRQQEHRVDRGHLGIDRDRFGPFLRSGDQREAAAPRAGEADGLDARVGDQGRAQLVGGALQQREGALRQAVLGHGVPDGPSDQLGRARMGRVALDDHRAAGGQRGGGVATGDREREREVARSEDRDRSDRDRALPQVRAGQRRTVGQRGVDADAVPDAVADHGGEQPQLADGAGGLAGHPAGGQAGFGGDALGQGRAEGLDVGGDAVQERRALLGGGPPVGREGFRGQSGGPVDLGGAGLPVRGVELGAGRGVDRPERPAVRAYVG